MVLVVPLYHLVSESERAIVTGYIPDRTSSPKRLGAAQSVMSNGEAGKFESPLAIVCTTSALRGACTLQPSFASRPSSTLDRKHFPTSVRRAGLLAYQPALSGALALSYTVPRRHAHMASGTVTHICQSLHDRLTPLDRAPKQMLISYMLIERLSLSMESRQSCFLAS
jgi:hypothetical protein